jgi:hypothetical protein
MAARLKGLRTRMPAGSDCSRMRCSTMRRGRVSWEKGVTPAGRRQTVVHLVAGHGMSERRACRVLGCCRMTLRYEAVRQDAPLLRERLKELAKVRRRFGYRRLHVFLRREGHEVNHKRRFRIYREERLHVRRRGGRKRAMGTRAPMVLPVMPKQRWSLDPRHGHSNQWRLDGSASRRVNPRRTVAGSLEPMAFACSTSRASTVACATRF